MFLNITNENASLSPDIILLDLPSTVERRSVSGGRNKVAPLFTFTLPDMVTDAAKEKVPLVDFLS